jgi:hypothetical protein
MQINLTPTRGSAPLTLARSGDVLTIAGEAFDFSGIPDGATLPRAAVACPWLLSDVERIGGEIVLTLILPHGPAAPEATRFPAAIIDPPDGAVTLPDFGADVPE